MTALCSIFGQILELIPTGSFRAAVAAHKAERHARGFSSWTQMVAMLFCHLGQARSLREITGGLAACEGRLRRLGVKEPPVRSTLAYANAHRPWHLYKTVFEDLYAQFRGEAAGRARKFRFRNPLLSLDSTVIPLCLASFDWARYRRAKGAVKLHLVLDHDGYLPRYAVITEGRSSDLRAARTMVFEPGTMLVFDRGYADYGWWLELTRGKVNFVTRLKDSAEYGVVHSSEVPADGQVVRDEVILLTARQEEGPEALLRRVEVWLEDKGEHLVLVTNNLKLSASTIAAIYRERWRIELFFKALKQSLRVRTFVGFSENAVQTQIWTALITMLLLACLRFRSSFGWCLSHLVALLRHQLFISRDLWQWLDSPFESPPAPPGEPDGQLRLGFGA